MSVVVRRLVRCIPVPLIVIALGVYPRETEAQTVSAGECCLSLLFPIGARAMALGNAVVARGYGDALFVNPALLSAVEDDEFLVHNLSTSGETGNTFTLLFRTEVAGSFALSYRLLELGEQELRDGAGNPIGTLNNFNHGLIATYATPVVAGLNAGVSYVLFQERTDCQGFCASEETSGTTHLIDVGVQLRPRAIPSLNVGASLTNFGFALQIRNRAQADPTPSRLRVGAAYEILHHFRPDSLAEAWISGELVQSWRELGGAALNVGVEVELQKSVFLRAGYATGDALFSGVAVGVGVRYNRFNVAAAKTFASTLADDADPFQITFGVRF